MVEQAENIAPSADHSRTTELFSSGFEIATRHQLLLRAFAIFEPPKGESVVYFVECGGLIKIGTTNQMSERLRQISTASPAAATLLATQPGGCVAERATHAKFAHLRRHGEWFADAPELREHIEGVLDGRWDLRAASPTP